MAQDMASYMREYRRAGRDSTRRPTVNPRRANPKHVPGHHAHSSETSIVRDEIERHKLRDGSDLMWPERVVGRDPTAEVRAALSRHHRHQCRSSKRAAARSRRQEEIWRR